VHFVIEHTPLVLPVHADKYDFEWRSALYGLPVCDLWCGLDAGVEARQAVLVLHPHLHPVHHTDRILHIDHDFIGLNSIKRAIVLFVTQHRHKLHLEGLLLQISGLLILLRDSGDGICVDPYCAVNQSWHL